MTNFLNLKRNCFGDLASGNYLEFEICDLEFNGINPIHGAPRASPWSLKDAHVGRHPDHTMAHSSTAKAVVFCLSG
jgi:hypothetical protein